MYLKDYYYADPDSDILAAGREEALEEAAVDKDDVAIYGCAGEKKSKIFYDERRGPWRKIWSAFGAVFIAEWGARTQVAMIGLHSSLPVIPVMMGSIVAFFLLCLSAVMVAAVVENHKVSERLILGLVTLSFIVFAILSFHDGLSEQQAALDMERKRRMAAAPVLRSRFPFKWDSDDTE